MLFQLGGLTNKGRTNACSATDRYESEHVLGHAAGDAPSAVHPNDLDSIHPRALWEGFRNRPAVSSRDHGFFFFHHVVQFVFHGFGSQSQHVR